ncbi:MAG: hypothetical protein MZV70_49385, partial [Desulfobacterales bacterium]|nr:hypothetical protein [Desulfobacterales bacterium]
SVLLRLTQRHRQLSSAPFRGRGSGGGADRQGRPGNRVPRHAAGRRTAVHVRTAAPGHSRQHLHPGRARQRPRDRPSDRLHHARLRHHPPPLFFRAHRQRSGPPIVLDEIQAEQYLNLGRPADALARLELVPLSARTPAILALLAQASYTNREYARVLEILEGKDGGRTYAELTLLANSAIELKRYDKAVVYPEQLRQYGDNAGVNHLLAAAWTVLGDTAKAGKYHAVIPGARANQSISEASAKINASVCNFS